MKKMHFLLMLLISCSVSICLVRAQKQVQLLEKKDFEQMVRGKPVRLFTLKNQVGTTAQITNYGAKLVALWIKDRNGNFRDVVLGHSSIKDYLASGDRYFGATIGRYGNRIDKGRFTIRNKNFTLTKNNGENHLHGGPTGFHEVVWEALQIDQQGLVMTYLSKHMDEGYPGNLQVKMKYQLTDKNELKIEYWATTDQVTIVNLTHHSYFNLKGAGTGTINNHLLQINADYYTPVNPQLIPTGEIVSVDRTPMDFRKARTIGGRLNEKFEQLMFGLGYDHNYVINQSENQLNFAATVIEPESGRTMEVYTNEPGLQFYGGNFLNGSIVGKEDRRYDHRSAFCLETQHFPDSPNNSHFPTTILTPEEEYYSICIYKFSTKN